MTADVARPWRHERKFRISPAQHAAAARWCRRALAPDPHAGPGGVYFIRSVYLDSIFGDDHADKTAGALARRKIRLRAYSDCPETVHLERKAKFGIQNRKERLALPLAAADALLAGDFEVLLQEGTATALRFYADLRARHYRPVVSVEYEREAYILPFEDVRVTFDHAVRASVADFGLTGPKSMVPLFPDGDVVLEIKYDAEFPRWAANWLGAAADEVQIAVSKFGLALEPWRAPR